MCPDGFYCDSTIQNDTHCSHGVQNPQPCPFGHFCPNGTRYDMEHPCPNGTYSSQSQLGDDISCTPCPEGWYCGEEGLTTPSGLCAPGYVCLGGADTPTPMDGVTGNICPPGTFCPEGSNYTSLCPPGTYSPTPGRCKVQVYWLITNSMVSMDD